MTFERQKPFWWEMAKVLISCAVAIAAFTGCHSTFYYPTGQKAGVVYSNVKYLTIKNGDFTIYADTIDNATPTNVAMIGVTDIGATAARAGFALGNPGTIGATVLLAQQVTPRIVKAPRRSPTPKTVPFSPVGQ